MLRPNELMAAHQEHARKVFGGWQSWYRFYLYSVFVLHNRSKSYIYIYIPFRVDILQSRLAQQRQQTRVIYVLYMLFHPSLSRCVHANEIVSCGPRDGIRVMLSFKQPASPPAKNSSTAEHKHTDPHIRIHYSMRRVSRLNHSKDPNQ